VIGSFVPHNSVAVCHLVELHRHAFSNLYTSLPVGKIYTIRLGTVSGRYTINVLKIFQVKLDFTSPTTI